MNYQKFTWHALDYFHIFHLFISCLLSLIKIFLYQFALVFLFGCYFVLLFNSERSNFLREDQALEYTAGNCARGIYKVLLRMAMMVAAGEENSAIRSLQSNYDGSYFLRLRRGCVCLQKIMIKRRRENEIFLLPMDCLYLSVALWKKQRSQVIVKHNGRGVALKVWQYYSFTPHH